MKRLNLHDPKTRRRVLLVAGAGAALVAFLVVRHGSSGPDTVTAAADPTTVNDPNIDPATGIPWALETGGGLGVPGGGSLGVIADPGPVDPGTFDDTSTFDDTGTDTGTGDGVGAGALAAAVGAALGTGKRGPAGPRGRRGKPGRPGRRAKVPHGHKAHPGTKPRRKKKHPTVDGPHAQHGVDPPRAKAVAAAAAAIGGPPSAKAVAAAAAAIPVTYRPPTFKAI